MIVLHYDYTISQCVLTLRESDVAATDAIAGTFCYCCWNNQSFSACAIEDLQVLPLIVIIIVCSYLHIFTCRFKLEVFNPMN